MKLWRTDAGVTREALAEAARYSADTVKAMEQGVRMPTRQLLDAADELCSAGGKLVAASQYLRREKFPARSQDFFAHEAGAISLWSYEVALVPGLLQTEATVRALLRAHRPPLDDDVIEERLAARLDRQSVIFRRPPAECSFVIYEAVVRCPVGGIGAHRQQLAHLLDIGRRHHVSIQVLPFERGGHAGLNGPMVLLETVEHEAWVSWKGSPSAISRRSPKR
ncbi:hypothetical protein N566_05355 [Streptomycetaceae bacterium MP113-05]|nr:hypothetical protein N566_05355 [Streptomycetaceae bacterium MP113-05]